jgi:hypothetical protein
MVFVSPHAMVSASARVKGLRIALIEDDSAKAVALSSSLVSLGAVVTVGDRGENGYEATCRALPDAIVSDLVTPGQHGWQLLQRIRRHPVLRFTPVLLFRFWEPSPDGRGIVRLTRVLDRLEEMLAPLRVLEDRLAAARPSSERLELTGPGPLLRLLAKLRLSGLLTVNDTWSVFEVHVDRGELHAIVRRGLGGGVDTGDAAFLQLLLCETGRWSWRNLPTMETAANLRRSIDRAMEEASPLLGAVFSPGRNRLIRDPRHLTVQTDLLADLTGTMSLSSQRVIEALLVGLLPEDIGRLFAKDDPGDIERALQSLVRCGAIRIHRLPRMSTVGLTQQAAAKTAMAMLEMLNQEAHAPDNPTGHVIIADSTPSPPLSTLPPRVPTPLASSQSSRGLEVAAAPLENRTGLPSSDFDELPSNRPTLPDSYLGGSTSPPGPASESYSSYSVESYSPSGIHEHEKGSPVQMWIGLGLALLTGIALIAGLLLLASGGKDSPRQSNDTTEQNAREQEGSP